VTDEFCKDNAKVKAPSIVSLALASSVAVPVPSNLKTSSKPSFDATAGKLMVTADDPLLM
jgi:hypothetical protein